MKRPLTEDELEAQILEDEFSEPFSSESDSLHEPSDQTDSSSEDDQSEHGLDQNENIRSNIIIDWKKPTRQFVPAKKLPAERNCELSPDITKNLSPMQIFHKVFPYSLYLLIANYTNERLKISNRTRKRLDKMTDRGELQIMIGTIFIMSYNKLPSLKNYWSTKKSLGNEAIRGAISRDRFLLLASKLYFAFPQKSNDASKTYYIDNLVDCLKYTFQKCRTDSTYQSIDESMTKFKGRSSLKQYMPLKPTKRGIKLWLRCDSSTGYTYDFNIYTGKDTEKSDIMVGLGERVVTKLASTIKADDVVLCFDRFFTSVNLLQTIKYPALGTVITNRKNVPVVKDKLKRGECVFLCSSTGLLYSKWHDTKEVSIISNCHKADVTQVSKTIKSGSKINIDCPEVIGFYRKNMGGVDRADQLIGLYSHDRKSCKWWKKVFYTLLNMAAVNSWIMYNQIRQKKTPFLSFLVTLSEELLAEGSKNTSVHYVKKGVTSKKRKLYGEVSLHLPIEGQTRRRCSRCSQNKQQTRTKTLCQQCDIPLCKNCFMLYHTAT